MSNEMTDALALEVMSEAVELARDHDHRQGQSDHFDEALKHIAARLRGDAEARDAAIDALACRLESYADAEDLALSERADLIEAAARLRGEAGEVCMVPVSHDYCGQRVRLVPEVADVQ